MSEVAYNTLDLPLLSESVRPMRLHHFPVLASTNDKAAEMRKLGLLYAPAMVLTSTQTAGRGRAGNRWFSDAGSITVTYALPVEEDLQPHQLPLVTGLAVRDACTELTGQRDIQLKWPNDVIHDGRKLAGLLCERIAGVDLIGIGLNVNITSTDLPADLRFGIASLSLISGSPHDLTRTLILLTQHLQHSLRTRHSRPFAAFVDQYRQHDGLLGKQIAVHPPGEAQGIRGTCEGIDTEGRLLLRSGLILHRIIAGSVTVE